METVFKSATEWLWAIYNDVASFPVEKIELAEDPVKRLLGFRLTVEGQTRDFLLPLTKLVTTARYIGGPNLWEHFRNSDGREKVGQLLFQKVKPTDLEERLTSPS